MYTDTFSTITVKFTKVEFKIDFDQSDFEFTVEASRSWSHVV